MPMFPTLFSSRSKPYVLLLLGCLLCLLFAPGQSARAQPLTPAWVANYQGLGSSPNTAALAVGAQGSVYVTAVSHDPFTGITTTITLKYDANGNQLWAARSQGPLDGSSPNTAALAVDAQGSVYVTNGIATLKYDTNGNQLWGGSYGGEAIALDAQNNAYVTNPSYNFSTGIMVVTTVKYDTNGNQRWIVRSQGTGGSYYNVVAALAVDAQGSVYVTSPIATVKYDTNGSQLWVGRYGGAAIVLDAQNNAYVTGPARPYREVRHQR